MIVDTSALLAFFDTSEPSHPAAVRLFEGETGNLVVSPFVVAELDHLVATRVGQRAELAVLDELAGGAWELAPFDRADLAAAARVIEAYPDQSIGVADASLVVLAERHATTRVATLDRRHFEVLRPISGGRFDIVP